MPNAVGLPNMSRMRERHLGGSRVTDRHLCNIGVGKDLVKLYIEACENITDISFLADVESLEEVTLEGCRNVVRGIFELGRMPRLQTLSLKDTVVTDASLSGLRFSRSLVKLLVESCAQLTDVAPVAAVKTLEEARFDGCRNVVKGVGELGRVPYLHILSLRETGVTDQCLQGLCCSRSLVELSLESCVHITDVGPLHQIDTLKAINLDRCENVIKGIGELGKMPRLQTLSMRETRVTDETLYSLRNNYSLVEITLECCLSITDVSPLSTIVTLQRINLGGCRNVVKGAGPLSKLPDLHELSVRGSAITDSCVSDLSESKSLRRLDLSSCENVTDVLPCCRIKLLEEIDLSRCRNISCGVGDMAKLSLLRVLSLVGTNTSDNCLRMLSTNYNITVLDVSFCGNLVDMTPIASIELLEVLRANGCKGVVRGVGGLGKLRSLRELSLKEASIKNKSLDGLGESQSLVQLDLASCERLTDVTSLSHVKTLEILNLNGCKNVTEGLDCMVLMQRLRCLHVVGVRLRSAVLKDLESLNVFVDV
uniref:Putative leucine-rich repeat protein (LRRP) n=1 Tax=Trypanosoma congolense (strain IL3000) TaxID=1068625 RepID=G0UP99_TRYCI|nr:putative leucine-rich repeat protein (LRRP) [Trypanosoma congolense IL3000]